MLPYPVVQITMDVVTEPIPPYTRYNGIKENGFGEVESCHPKSDWYYLRDR